MRDGFADLFVTTKGLNRITFLFTSDLSCSTISGLHLCMFFGGVNI